MNGRFSRMGLHAAGVLTLLAVVLWCRVQGDSGIMEATLGPWAKPVYRVYYFLHFAVDAAAQRTLGTHGLHETVRMFICIAMAGGLWALGYISVRLGRRVAQAIRARRALEPGTPTMGPLSRRQFFADTGFATAALLGCGAAYPVVRAPEVVRTVRYRLSVADWPAPLEGLRAVHISDTHFGKLISRPYLEHVIAQANALAPDLVLLTGDYVQHRMEDLAPGIGIFDALQPRLGTVAVLGNHDHWVSAKTSRAAFEHIGIPLLDNGRRYLGEHGLVERADEGLVCLAGVGDLWEDTVDFRAALGGVPEAMPRLLLSHNPDVAELDNPFRVDAMFSGHTHGGQVALPGIGPLAFTTRYGQKYIAGVCQGPWTQAVVSRGVGVVGLPIRLWCPAEIVEVTIVRA